ncbi:type II secretion system minor pseudopilin GspJ [Reinekea marinisedimentorum]|uniref:Type II secretion system protein J n=1 Tax=Reinekea marinisedimentorum TaxID=230495 RepID=A0A4R3I9I6_9GAMM|nr:type II secretion system minor pseudopilin GspJ [Reinekea marinisedimentorum]TCS42538.1 general secretion pathway protein J [Reinekea marinisedimentorum]
MNRQLGLTLIELLVALALGAIIAIGTFRLFHTSVTTRDTLALQTEELTRLSRAFKVIEQDFSQFVPNRPVKDAYGDYQEALAMDFDGLYLTRNGWSTSRIMSYERSSLQRVRYSLEENGSDLCPWLEIDGDENPNDCLVRSYRAHLDDNGDSVWHSQILLRPVSALEWRFYVYNKTAKSNDYETEPPARNIETEEFDSIARAVELNITAGEIQNQHLRLFAIPTEAYSSDEGDS